MTRFYSNVDIFTEEAIRKEQHGCAIVVTFRGKRGKNPWMRIIPSIRWNPDDFLNVTGLLNHESVHICLWNNLGMEVYRALDKLPEPKSFEEFFLGVWGLNIGKRPT